MALRLTRRSENISYSTQAKLARDQGLTDRVTACAASEKHADPVKWAFDHRWELSAEPGWDDAYAYAVRNGITNPGDDEGVITDGMILSAVQMLLNQERTV